MFELAKVFLRLGCLGFGGPLATISMMEEEAVGKRGWIEAKTFSKNYSLIKILPGPVATQMATRIGWLKAGIPGGLLAASLFVLPSFFFILILGIFLSKIGGGKTKDIFILGMQVSALAVILQGSWRLASGNVKGLPALLISIFSFTLVLVKPALEPLAILAFGLLGVGLYFFRRTNNQRSQNSQTKLLEGGMILIITFICLKAALLTFGTGLAIIPLLQNDVVEKYKLVNNSDFLQAMALGQITPGPVIITVTWIGYKAAGFLGAVVATLAIFLPGVLSSLFMIPWFDKKYGQHAALESFYAFAVPAVVGGMFAVCTRLLVSSLGDALSLGLFVGALPLVFWKKAPAWFVIPLFGLMALILNFILPQVVLHLPV